jgi:hypothetical protein
MGAGDDDRWDVGVVQGKAVATRVLKPPKPPKTTRLFRFVRVAFVSATGQYIFEGPWAGTCKPSWHDQEAPLQRTAAGRRLVPRPHPNTY